LRVADPRRRVRDPKSRTIGVGRVGEAPAEPVTYAVSLPVLPVAERDVCIGNEFPIHRMCPESSSG
jgi:hypothetical protein